MRIVQIVQISAVLALCSFSGCGGKSPPSTRQISPENITKLHDLLGHPTTIGDVSSTEEAQVNAVDLEKMKQILAKPRGMVEALDLLAAETPDVEISMWQQADHRVMLPEIEALLGKADAVKPGPLRGGEANWHQFGWIKIAFVYGGETKGDTSQNAGAIRISVREYKDSKNIAPAK